MKNEVRFAVEEIRYESSRVYVYPHSDRLCNYCTYGDYEIFYNCSLDDIEGLKNEIAKWFFPENFEWMDVNVVLTDMFGNNI